MNNQYVPYITDNEEVKELIFHVWENKEEGVHAWKPVIEGYVTIEAGELEGEDYLIIQVTDEIDFLGYPCGVAYAFETLFEDEIEKLKTTA